MQEVPWHTMVNEDLRQENLGPTNPIQSTTNLEILFSEKFSIKNL